MNKSSLSLAAVLMAAQCLAGAVRADDARNYLYIVGSTVIQPYGEEVAKRAPKKAKLRPPLFESNGTNGGIIMFCEGEGMAYPDIVNTARPFRKTEIANCQKNGVLDIVELKLGYDGLVLANNKKSRPLELTRKDIYLALAKQVPDPSCKEHCDKLVPNPYKTWKQVNPALPDVKIEVLGPPYSSGAMEIFAEYVSEASCNKYPEIAAKKAKNEKEYKRICDNIREDGAYTQETGEVIAKTLDESPDAVGIMTYSRLKENASHLQGAKLEGVVPNDDTVADQSYPISGPLFMYVKKSQAGKVPGMEAYLTEFTSEKALGKKGYLIAKGLVAMSSMDQKASATDAKELKPLVMDPVRHH